MPNIFDTLTAQDTDLYLKVLSLSIEEGSIQYGPVIKDGRIGIKTIIKGEQKDCKDSDIKVSASLEIVFNNAGFPLTAPEFVTVSDGVKHVQVRLPFFAAHPAEANAKVIVVAVILFAGTLILTKNPATSARVASYVLTI